MKKILLFLLVVASFSVNAQQRIIGANNVVTILAGEGIPNWTLVRITAGKAWKANSAKIDSAAVGIAIDTAFAANDTIQVAFSGTLQGFAVEKGKDYFLGAGGTFTATKPTSIYSQKVGTWVEDSTLQLSILQALPIYNTETFINLASDVSNSTTTPANITSLSFTAEANSTYIVRFYGECEFAATTTGIGIVLSIPDGGQILGRVGHNLASQTFTAHQQLADNSVAGTSATNGTGTSGNPDVGIASFVDGVWLVKIVTGGTVQANFRSEISGSNVTLLAGSKMSYLKI